MGFAWSFSGFKVLVLFQSWRMEQTQVPFLASGPGQTGLDKKTLDFFDAWPSTAALLLDQDVADSFGDVDSSQGPWGTRNRSSTLEARRKRRARSHVLP